MNQEREQDHPEAAEPEDVDSSAVEGEEGTIQDDPLAVARRERAEFKDQYQRALAEMENLRKRHQREMRESRQYAVAELARDLLTVVDTLQRALDGVPEDQSNDAFFTGVRLVGEQLRKTLADHGVTPVEALDKPFDPNWHEAIMEDERDDVEPGTITEELIRGFRLGDRLLRASVVKVARTPSRAGLEKGDEKTKKHQGSEPEED